MKKQSTLASALALGLLFALSSTAQANPRAKPAKAAKPLKKRAAQFRPAAVSDQLTGKIGKRQVMAVTNDNVGAYVKAMKKDTVEVIFMPNASSYGHITIRVGDRHFDMPNPSGARTSTWRGASGKSYGFSFKVGEQKVTTLMREFDNLMEQGPRFSIAGTGPECFSCAGFVTKILAQVMPELKVGVNPGAKGAGRALLRNSQVHAITLYNAAAQEAANESFKFEKLE